MFLNTLKFIWFLSVFFYKLKYKNAKFDTEIFKLIIHGLCKERFLYAFDGTTTEGEEFEMFLKKYSPCYIAYYGYIALWLL